MSQPAPALADLRGRTVVSIAEAGALLGLSVSAAYRASARGDLGDLITVNGRSKVPLAPLLARLGLPYEPTA